MASALQSIGDVAQDVRKHKLTSLSPTGSPADLLA